MQKAPVHYSDLQLLHSFFCNPASPVSVSDPDERLIYEKQVPEFTDDGCFNLSSDPEGANMKFCFGRNAWKGARTYIYVNNPDGTIRWMVPEEITATPHLLLYNASTLKARIYKSVSRVLFSMGRGKLLASGTLSVEQNLVEQVEDRYGLKGNSYAIFTGTRGKTRKVVIAESSGNKITHFIKIPVNEESQKLVENEINMLSELSKYDFTALSIPHVTDPRIKAYARLSNVKPAVTIPSSRITEIHVRALSELYTASNEKKAVTQSAAWSSIANNIEWMQRERKLENGLDEMKTRRIIHLLLKLHNQIEDKEIPLSVSHGDFTPWNMYSDDRRLYVYDWELASNGIPMLFDLFHFIIQSQVLIYQKEYPAVRRQVRDALMQPSVQRIVNRYRIDTALHYRLYLLFTVSYYLRIYICEKELLTQSHWMIDLWHDALEDVYEEIK